MFAIVESDDGLTVIELQPGETCEEAATRNRAQLADSEPYLTYESACEAMMEIDLEDEEDEASAP